MSGAKPGCWLTIFLDSRSKSAKNGKKRQCWIGSCPTFRLGCAKQGTLTWYSSELSRKIRGGPEARISQHQQTASVPPTEWARVFSGLENRAIDDRRSGQRGSEAPSMDWIQRSLLSKQPLYAIQALQIYKIYKLHQVTSSYMRCCSFTKPGDAASRTLKQSMISPAKCLRMTCLYGGRFVHSKMMALTGKRRRAAVMSWSISSSALWKSKSTRSCEMTS